MKWSCIFAILCVLLVYPVQARQIPEEDAIDAVKGRCELDIGGTDMTDFCGDHLVRMRLHSKHRLAVIVPVKPEKSVAFSGGYIVRTSKDKAIMEIDAVTYGGSGTSLREAAKGKCVFDGDPFEANHATTCEAVSSTFLSFKLRFLATEATKVTPLSELQ